MSLITSSSNFIPIDGSKQKIATMLLEFLTPFERECLRGFVVIGHSYAQLVEDNPRPVLLRMKTREYSTFLHAYNKEIHTYYGHVIRADGSPAYGVGIVFPRMFVLFDGYEFMFLENNEQVNPLVTIEESYLCSIIDEIEYMDTRKTEEMVANLAMVKKMMEELETVDGNPF